MVLIDGDVREVDGYCEGTGDSEDKDKKEGGGKRECGRQNGWRWMAGY